MVYAGPSNGCLTCKKRRVKCDETRPVCRNCTRRRVPCPGFPDPPGTKFRDETDAVIRHAQRGERKTRPERDDDYAAAESFGTNLGQDESFVSLCFFFHNYVITGRGIQSSRGVFENLLPYYNPNKADSLVSLAVAAVAASMLSIWRLQGPDSAASRQYVGRAITLLRDTLTDPDGCVSDETLIAILLLQYREGIIAHSKMVQVDGSHQNGAYAVVKHRQSKGFRNDASKRLLQAVRSTMVSEAIRHRQPVNMEPAVWDDEEPMPHNPSSDLDRIGVDVANLQALFERYKKAVQTESVLEAIDVRTLAAFKRTANDVDERLEIWATAQSRQWSPIPLLPHEIPESIKRAGVYRNLCDVYPTVQIASVWHTYKSYRLILLKIILSCEQTELSLQPVKQGRDSDHSNTRAPSTAETFQELVDEMCAAVPFHLGSRTEPGFIGEFSRTDNVDFPWPPPEKDPFSNSYKSGNLGGDGNLSPMTSDERKRHAIGMGGWHILGPLSFVLGMASESLELGPLRENARKVGCLLRQDQIPWLAGQLRRALMLHRMKREGPENPGNMERGKYPPEKDASLARDVTGVKKALRYAIGV
ncbi:uncharacterized protein Z518_03279 [Rhinocladiella mackenziei CBS 650.93]|uniref:Zn(2)-C6 fungal-type domain-containing protein n=1 Tax=Rhinocladiella mackenziei CBS 650.93 TaxID=1442369 RepID=A0A0D2HDL1_9EURO|nr:uncharacterized protein Z518_03279 [Rhinocladiella mackenziei CBS 650.93]KIX08623.1 hypothetical protein Z518_03279 [Rhinocladiella mackenziei CBS 650.93]